MRISDWSSDVCSSDLVFPGCANSSDNSGMGGGPAGPGGAAGASTTGAGGKKTGAGKEGAGVAGDRQSVVQGKGVSVRVDLGGLRIITKKKIDHIVYV